MNIIVDNAQPLGAYPHGRVIGGFVFVSGASSRQPDNSIVGAKQNADGSVSYDVAAQTRAVFDSIARVLAEVGAGLGDVVDVTSFLVDMEDFAEYNRVYGEIFDRSSGPARTTVAVHQLPHPDLRIEVKAIAAIPG